MKKSNDLEYTTNLVDLHMNYPKQIYHCPINVTKVTLFNMKVNQQQCLMGGDHYHHVPPFLTIVPHGGYHLIIIM